MIEDVILRALGRRIERLTPSSFGLRSHALPTEDHLDACVRAATSLLQEPTIAGARFVIGSSRRPSEPLAAGVVVLEPHAAAAEATRLRNLRAQTDRGAGYLIYLNTDSTPGEAGLNVLEELRAEDVAEAYAASASLPLLKELAERRARLVRQRIADTSVEVLARYASMARSEGEARALPLLGLIPTRQQKALPGPAPARELDLLRGVKAANSIEGVVDRLKNVSPEQREAIERRLAGTMLPGTERPLVEGRALATNALAFATGVNGDPAELCGLTVEFARLLRSGAAALDLPSADPDDTSDDGSDTPAGTFSDDDLADELPELFARGTICGELNESKDEDPSFSVSSDEGATVALRATTPRGLLRALLASDDREALDRYVRCGDSFEVSDAAQLKSARRIPGVKVRGRASEIEREIPSLTPALRDATTGFLLARKELMATLRSCFSFEQEESGGDAAEARDGGVVMALALLDVHPLLVAARVEPHAERYVRAYDAVIAAAYPDGAPSQRTVEWLANLDLAFVVHGPSVIAARLLPLHPLRVARALLWHRNGVEPPAFPPRLALSYDQPQALLPDNVPDVYAATQRAWPSSRGVALAMRQGLAALWALLAPRRLVSSLAVDLVDLPDVPAAIDALCAEARKRFEDDATVGSGLHLDVRVLFSETKRAESWRSLEPDDLSATAREAWEATRGDGVSVGLPREALTFPSAQMSHLAVQAVDTPFAKLVEDASAGGGGLSLKYIPGPNGNVAMIGVRAEQSLDTYDRMLDGLELAHRPSGLDPMTRSPEVGSTLVRALVARGGWPVKPTPDLHLLNYAELDGHVVAVLCDGAAIKRDLDAALARVTTSAQGLDLKRLREAVLALYSCRALLHELLEGLDERHLRAQVALTRAYVVARANDPWPTLPISLDSPEGHRWARAVQRHFNVDRSRADLILADAEGDARTSLHCLRVVELKARQQTGTFSTPTAREQLSTQARLAAARVRACFEAGANSEPRAALQRLVWMEASRQQLALVWKDVLQDFERGLELGACPRLIVECWIVPEAPWSGDERFEETFPRLDVKGTPIPGETITVRIFVMPPLELGAPPPRGNGKGPSGRAPSKPAALASSAAPAAAPLALIPSAPPTPTEPALATGAHNAASISAPAPSSRDEGAPEASADDAEGIVIRVGDLARAAGTVPAIWTPNRVDRVNHYNVGITGTMGTGKTQLTKSLLAQLAGQGVRNPGGKAPGVLIFDYKGDYGFSTRDDFPRRVGATVLRPEALPLNPLRPSAPESRQDLTRIVYAFADTLSAIEPRIGRVQRDEVIRGVQACLADSGIDAGDPTTFARPFPTLRDLLDHLTQNRMAEGSPQSLLREMVDLGVFAEEDPPGEIDALFDGLHVVDLKPLAGMRATIRAIIAFFTNAFYRQMLQLPEAPLAAGSGRGRELRQLRRLILVDEADDFLSLGVESLRYILQQGRSFGCGVILSTQFLSHFDQGGEELKASIGTWFLHQMTNLDRKDLTSLFGLASRDEAAALATHLSDLPKHTSLCRGLSTEGCRDRLVEVRDLPFKDLPSP